MVSKKYSHTSIKLAKSYQSPNTIDIPESYRSFLDKKICEYGSFSFYVNRLIARYSHLILDGNIKPDKGVKTLYQDKGLNLYHEKFRCYDKSDWSVLKILANCLNVSRCLLVVMFIEFDMIGLEGKVVTTNSFKSFAYQELYNPKKSTLIRTKINFAATFNPKTGKG